MEKHLKNKFPFNYILTTLLFSLATSGYARSTILKKQIDVGAYELAYSQDNKIIVATTLNRDEKGGMVYELNPKTLDVINTIKTENKPFGVALNNTTKTAYFGGSTEGCLIAVDIITGQVKGTLQLISKSSNQGGDNKSKSESIGLSHNPSERSKTENRDNSGNNKDKRPPAPREVVVDETSNTVYVSGVNRDDSVIWVVDGNTMTLKKTIHGFGIMNTGLAIDETAHRVYTSNASGEFISINTDSYSIDSRVKITSDGNEHMLMNISLDQKGRRAFISDNKAAGIIVVDLSNHKVLNNIAVPETLDVLFNPVRNEIYATHRNQGTISIINGETYNIVKTVDLPVHPNSLALATDGTALYVSVKQDTSRDQPTTLPDDIVRISLD